MLIRIIRTEETKESVRGMMLINGCMFCVTMERPNLNNEQNISCIPKGVYKARKYTSKRHGKTLVIEGVPNRSGILFHIGNYAMDSEGCVLLGDNFAKNSKMITSSTSAMARFREAIKDEKLFTVEIV